MRWLAATISLKVSADLAPGGAGYPELDPLPGIAVAPDVLADALQLLGHALVGGRDLVEGVRDLAGQADLLAGHPHREIARADGLQRMQQLVFERSRAVSGPGSRVGQRWDWGGAVGLGFTVHLGLAFHAALRSKLKDIDPALSVPKRPAPLPGERNPRREAAGNSPPGTSRSDVDSPAVYGTADKSPRNPKPCLEACREIPQCRVTQFGRR